MGRFGAPGITAYSPRVSHKTPFSHRNNVVAPNDEMIDKTNVDHPQHVLDPLGDDFIRGRGLCDARRVIGGVSECHPYLSRDRPAVKSGVMSSPRLCERRVASEGGRGEGCSVTHRAHRRSFSAATLERLRDQPSEAVLARLAIDLKADPTFLPIKDIRSRRWHVHTTHGDFEILTTGLKWYDTRACKGGGGAIDLAMHLLGLSFVEAVRHLADQGGTHGSDRP